MVAAIVSGWKACSGSHGIVRGCPDDYQEAFRTCSAAGFPIGQPDDFNNRLSFSLDILAASGRYFAGLVVHIAGV